MWYIVVEPQELCNVTYLAQILEPTAEIVHLQSQPSLPRVVLLKCSVHGSTCAAPGQEEEISMPTRSESESTFPLPHSHCQQLHTKLCNLPVMPLSHSCTHQVEALNQRRVNHCASNVYTSLVPRAWRQGYLYTCTMSVYWSCTVHTTTLYILWKQILYARCTNNQ